MTRPRGLGRGLDALLGEKSTAKENASLANHIRELPPNKGVGHRVNAVDMIRIQNIEANPNQPRRVFDERSLNELAESIKSHGIIQPITLRKIRASKYQIISGERRFRAAQKVGLTQLPAYVREADDQGLLEMALIENIQRKDLNPLEVGLSFRHLMEECKLTQEVLAQRVGMARSSVANYLRMLDLPEQIQQMLRLGTLGLGHAKTLSGVKGHNAKYTQIAFAEKASAEAVSVRELERWIKQGGWNASSVTKPTVAIAPLTADEELALHMLRTKLSSTQAKVALKRRSQGGGQLTLTYSTAEELDAVLVKLGLT